MAVQQKEDGGPEGEACGRGDSCELREGVGGRPEGEAGGQDPPGGQGVQGSDEAPRWHMNNNTMIYVNIVFSMLTIK